ncbi:UNVERIFIED_CONTAM: TerB family tellurite resistance protein [Kocuria sp. CPCC 205274]|uniref:TerB family tellurite resistance protein n=1 Tax=Herbiconiux daphne TaxID=2970914 RepID=A0ABT2HAK8_9MICO|nr:TerB family tellurite resistance protein [Herbiconiux daphne]MCS5736996.1 TerB family tellurite resistance protein [Herbiconiux daphne]
MFGWGKKAKNVVIELNKAEHRPIARAIVAAGVYIAAADGNIEDSEVNTLRSVIANNKTLAPFVPEANDWTNEFTSLIQSSPRTARLEILRVVEAVRNDRDGAQNVLVAALDIADANGGIGDDERSALTKVAEALGLNLKDYE